MLGNIFKYHKIIRLLPFVLTRYSYLPMFLFRISDTLLEFNYSIPKCYILLSIICQQKLLAQPQEEDNGGTSLNNPTTTSLKDHPTTPIDTSSSRLTLPTFKDLWGFEVQWQNTEDGWNPRRRERLIDLENKIIDQVAEMPAFTKEGYKKMKIPSHLYDLITQTVNPEHIKTERCDDFEYSAYPLYNCARLKEDGVTKGMLHIHNNDIFHSRGRMKRIFNWHFTFPVEIFSLLGVRN